MISPADKVKTLSELSKIVHSLKNEGKKIVQCHGGFDLLHPGHIHHFKSAKEYGDILIVTITADAYMKKGPGRPVFNQELRAEFLSCIEYIDYVAIINSDSAIDSIQKIQPDYYVKGPDYKNRKNNTHVPRKLDAEKEAVEKIGGKLIFTEDEVVFSSSHLINGYIDVFPPETKKYIQDFKKKYSDDVIFDKLVSLRNLKILLIGDAIIDQYHYCLPMGKSSKEPIIVHQYKSHETYAGGTLATANHISSLVNNISLLTVLGREKPYDTFILKHLKATIKPKFFYQEGTPTVVKRRYIDGGTKQKLFQISFIKEELPQRKLENEIIRYLKSTIKNYDLVVINDFGHNCLTRKLIRYICKDAKFLALNVQANSANFGFNTINKYPRADYICIDEHELRLATHDKYSEVKDLAKKVFRQFGCKAIFITRGKDGSFYLTKEKTGTSFHESPSLTQRIIDRVGAGDAFFAITSPCVYSGMDKELVSFIGNVAGALQVQVIGNKKPIELSEMAKYITRLLK